MSRYPEHRLGNFVAINGQGVKPGRWQGTYLYWKPNRNLALGGSLLARFYIDPRGNTTCNRWANPTLHIGFPSRIWRRACDGRWCWRVCDIKIPLPWLRFKHPEGRIRTVLSRLSRRFWHWVEYGRAVR